MQGTFLLIILSKICMTGERNHNLRFIHPTKPNGAAVILIGCAVIFAKFTVALTGLNLDATVLSYAPGGFAEMSLIGLALGIEVAMVATHHLFRLFLIVLTSPFISRFVLTRGR